MPDMSGPTFVKEWEKTNPQTQIRYMSGYIDDSVGHHSVSGDDVISKPFSPRRTARERVPVHGD